MTTINWEGAPSPRLKNLIIYKIAKALGASEVDYIHMANLQDDYLAAQDSSPQDLEEWESHHLEELNELQYLAGDCETLTDAKVYAHDLILARSLDFEDNYIILLQGGLRLLGKFEQTARLESLSKDLSWTEEQLTSQQQTMLIEYVTLVF